MSVTGLPFDDIRDLIASLPDGDERAFKHASERNEALSRQFGLGRREAETSVWLAQWTGRSPAVSRPMVALFAGTHGVCDQLDGLPGEGTLESVTRMAAGGAPVNQVCATQDIGLKVFDLALQVPVSDIAEADALNERDAAATIGFGMEAIAGGVDLLGLAAFGQGSEIANAAILGLLFDNPPETYLGHLPQAVADRLGPLAALAMERHRSISDPLELLRRLGGREHAALMGAILAARVNHVPAVLDGATAIVVANLLCRVSRDSLSHCRLASSVCDTDGPTTSVWYEAEQNTGLSVILPGAAGALDSHGQNAARAIADLKSVAAIHTNSVIDI